MLIGAESPCRLVYEENSAIAKRKVGATKPYNLRCGVVAVTSTTRDPDQRCKLAQRNGSVNNRGDGKYAVAKLDVFFIF